MEGLGFILFLVAIVASLFDQSRKGKGTGTPGGPPTRRPRPMDLPRPTRQLPQPGPSDPETEPRASAADMVPEDFWAELTGQRRPAPKPAPPAKPQPAPAPARSAPAPVRDLPSWDEEAVAAVEDRSREVAPEQPVALDAYRRREVVHEPPRIVSLETPVLPPEQRHAAFHRRLAASKPTAAELAPPRARPNPLRDRLRDRDTLRESFVLQEVFGPPKGLEE